MFLCARAVQAPGTWSIVFASPAHVFLHKAAGDELRSAAECGVALAGLLRRLRTVPLPAEAGELDYGYAGRRVVGEDFAGRARVEVDVAALLEQDVAGAPLRAALAPAGEPSEEARNAAEAALAATAAAQEAEVAAAAPPVKGGKGAAKAPAAAAAKAPAKGAKGAAAAAAPAAAAADAAAGVPDFDTSHAVLEGRLELTSPLNVRPKTPPPPEARPEDIVSARPPAPSAPAGLAASASFRAEVRRVLRTVAEQFVAAAREGAGDAVERRRRVLASLNGDGGCASGSPRAPHGAHMHSPISAQLRGHPRRAEARRRARRARALRAHEPSGGGWGRGGGGGA